jgi:hypothetical protein
LFITNHFTSPFYFCFVFPAEHQLYSEDLFTDQLDECDAHYFDDMFREMTYDVGSYTQYRGLDHTSLFASSVALSSKFAAIGANGYGTFYILSGLPSPWFSLFLFFTFPFIMLFQQMCLKVLSTSMYQKRP